MTTLTIRQLAAVLAAGCLPACLSTSASDTPAKRVRAENPGGESRPARARTRWSIAHMINPWGIALRPPGAGGHIWISNAGNLSTSTYIGDVKGSPLRQDGLKIVYLDGPLISYEDGLANVTGQVYNAASDFPGSRSNFRSQDRRAIFRAASPIPIGTVSGSAKFVFVTTDGTINAWRASTAESMDRGRDRQGLLRSRTRPDQRPARFCPPSPASRCRPSKQIGNRLYVTDFQNQHDPRARQSVARHHRERAVRAARRDCRRTSARTTSSSWTDGSTWRSRRSTWTPRKPATDVPAPGAGHVAVYDLDGHLVQEMRRRRPAELAVGPGDRPGELRRRSAARSWSRISATARSPRSTPRPGRFATTCATAPASRSSSTRSGAWPSATA